MVQCREHVDFTEEIVFMVLYTTLLALIERCVYHCNASIGYKTRAFDINPGLNLPSQVFMIFHSPWNFLSIIASYFFPSVYAFAPNRTYDCVAALGWPPFTNSVMESGHR